jgi:hypothetical protein
MLATPEDGMMGTISLSDLTDAVAVVAVAMKQRRAKILRLLLKAF